MVSTIETAFVMKPNCPDLLMHKWHKQKDIIPVVTKSSNLLGHVKYIVKRLSKSFIADFVKQDLFHFIYQNLLLMRLNTINVSLCNACIKGSTISNVLSLNYVQIK